MTTPDEPANYNVSQASEGFPEIAKASLIALAGTAIAVSMAPTDVLAFGGALVSTLIATANYLDNDITKKLRNAPGGHNIPY